MPMICQDKDLYITTMQAFSAAQVEYVVIGTFGLLLHGFIADDYVVNDCDVLLGGGEENLKRAWETVAGAGWQTFLWEQQLDSFPSANELKGKYYIRARKANASIDLCFEYHEIDVEQWLERKKQINQVFVADCEDIIGLKRKNDREKDRLVLAKLKQIS